MVWLSRFIAAILVSVITIAVLAQVFDTTLLNSKFLSTTATSSGVYNSLSEVLANKIVNNSNGSSGTLTPAQEKAKIQSVITPQLLQAKISALLPAIQAYYKGYGPQASINLSDVITKLQAAGLPIQNDNSTLSKPILVPENQQVKQQVRNFEKVKLYSLLTAIVLLAILFFLSWEEHRWKIIPDLSIIVGVYLGILSLLFIFGIVAADKYAKIKSANNADVVNTAEIYAKAITRGIGERLAIVAVILLVLGIVFRIVLHNIDKKKKPIKQQKTNSNLKLKSA